MAANASQGAYFSQSWGWVALAFLVPTTLLLLLERVTVPGRLRILFAAAMTALGVWVALSSIWSLSPAASIRETERMLVYVAFAFALALLLRRGDGPALLAGALAGTVGVTGYALGTRLFPDRFDTYDTPFLPYRLSEPLGYWNALGLLAALGIVLAVGVTAHARRHVAGALAAATLPIFGATLYFTFSRGAWASLAAGLVATVALDPRRLRLLWVGVVTAPAAVVAVVAATGYDALATEDAPRAAQLREGHRYALLLAGLVVCSALLALGARVVAARVSIGRRGRRTFDVAVACAVLVGLVAGIVAVGGPAKGLTDLRERFEAEPVGDADLRTRLFSVSGNGRSELLRVAWDVGRERPVAGRGAGTYERLWYDRRPSLLVVRDAHSLYLETFAELGMVGLGLLLIALSAPLIGALRARRSHLVAAGAGMFVAWASASALDWHWEMVGVTLTAFLGGAVGLIATERPWRALIRPPARVALASLGVVGSLFAVVSLVGNQALFAGREALLRKEWPGGLDHAERAKTLLPWSFEPDIVLGDAYAGLGHRQQALDAYRDAVEADHHNWVAWLRLAQVAEGAERTRAYARVRDLNPREERLPGEGAPPG